MKTILIRTQKRIMKNCVYLCMNEETNQSFIVDPSWNIDKILQASEENNCSINAIAVTHSHFDHTNLIDDIVSRFDIPVYVSRQEAHDYNYSCKNMILYDDNEVLNICGMNVKVLITPGHTSGSACFLCNDSLFAGDTLLIEGCTFIDDDGGDISELYSSINRLKDIIDDNVHVYPGHANHDQPGVTMGMLKKVNKYLQTESLADFEDLMNMKNILSLAR